MDGHFRAFSFVDRITCPGNQVRGVYQIPSGIGEFPLALTAEACGQLAAWTAMAAHDFKLRPVAGIAPVIELIGSVRPGQLLELEAELESLDAEAVAYSGSVKVAGTPVLRLQNCVGPMVPVEEYDDPAALKARYELISGAGATPGVFPGVPAIPLEFLGGEVGKSARAALHVPAGAAFFSDHFPRRPVFPGTLFMHKVLELASRVVDDISAPGPDAAWVARRINDSKIRAFMPPGESLEFEARLARQDGGSLTVHVEARKEKKVTGHSRIVFMAEQHA